ncbi:MAG: TSCPD domain-containing protein, partial [Sporomusaceae bacterium]|nr:TSCPD domain-containing protein [Sporomusaceae bacterium]
PEHVQRVFVTSHDVEPNWHVKMQAAFQKYTDNAVSKTVNLSHNATTEDVREVFLQAYRQNCKGVTIYRDGSRDMQVLNIGKVKGKEESLVPSTEGSIDHSMEEDAAKYSSKAPGSEEMKNNDPLIEKLAADFEGKVKTHSKPVIEPRPRPDITTGFTEKVRIGCGNLYITVNYDENGICEVFTNTGRAGGCPSQSEATSRLVSIALRSGLDVKPIVEQLKGIRCPSTIRQKDMKVLSCPDAIGRLIEKVAKLQSNREEALISDSGAMEEEIRRPKPTANCDTGCDDCTMIDVCNAPQKHELDAESTCKECGSLLEHEGGCVICRNCGYGKCG